MCVAGGKFDGTEIMNPRQLEACLAHLEAAEMLMVEAEDLAGLTRLSLVIEMLRRAHGMPRRVLDELTDETKAKMRSWLLQVAASQIIG